MQINWSMIACFSIGFFAIAGFSRGWWKEAVTTIILAILIFFLQNPDQAQQFIQLANDGIATVWSFVPNFMTTAITDFLQFAFGINTGGGPYQFDPADASTWLTILAGLVVVGVLIGRLSFGNPPTGLGKMLGLLVGGLNGFLILSLVREYLDGRALPGQPPPSTEITLVGSSAFGPASDAVSVQMVGLPNYTIMDSVIPWVLMGVGLLFLFSVLKTRVGVATNRDGRKIQTKLPPFYKVPPQKKEAKKTLVDIFAETLG